MINLKRKSNEDGYYYSIMVKDQSIAQYCGNIIKIDNSWFYCPDKINDLKLSAKCLSYIAEKIIELDNTEEKNRIGF